MTYHSCKHFGERYWQSSSVRRIGRNNLPLSLVRRNGSLREKGRLAGRNAEGVRASFLMLLGLVTWTAPISWLLVFDFVKQGSPPSDF